MHICPVCLINKFSYLFFLTNKLAKIYLPKHINKDSQPKKKKNHISKIIKIISLNS